MQKTNVPGIYKVTDGVLVSKDNEALSVYKLRKAKERRLDTLESKVENMDTTLQEIKNMLSGLINGTR